METFTLSFQVAWNLHKWCRIPSGFELKLKNLFIITLPAISLYGRHWYSEACLPGY